MEACLGVGQVLPLNPRSNSFHLFVVEERPPAWTAQMGEPGMRDQLTTLAPLPQEVDTVGLWEVTRWSLKELLPPSLVTLPVFLALPCVMAKR